MTADSGADGTRPSAPLFPDLTADQIHQATETRWDLDRPLPVPRPGWLACPVCRSITVQPRWWRWHERSGRPTVPHRCDVSFKCCDCAAVWTHGVAVPTDRYPQQRVTGRQIHWRDARQMLEEH